MEKKQENEVGAQTKKSQMAKTPRAPDGYKKEWNNTAKKVEYIKEDDDIVGPAMLTVDQAREIRDQGMSPPLIS